MSSDFDHRAFKVMCFASTTSSSVSTPSSAIYFMVWYIQLPPVFRLTSSTDPPGLICVESCSQSPSSVAGDGGLLLGTMIS